MSTKFNPYLNFNGTTADAMKFYQTVFGGDLEMTTFGQMEGMPVPEGYADKIMHATLTTPDVTIMASEGQPGRTIKVGDNITLSLSGENHDQLTGYFNTLAEGGSVMMPLGPVPWGDIYGMLTDKFGIQWMVNIVKPTA